MLNDEQPFLGEPTYRGLVYPWHCDHMGHMNVMWYVGKFDEATWNLMARVGLSAAYLRSSEKGLVAVEQQIFYRAELLSGDGLAIHSEFLEVKDKSIRFRHLMRRDHDGAIAAETTLTGVQIDSTARRACSLDPAIRERIQAMCDEGRKALTD